MLEVTNENGMSFCDGFNRRTMLQAGSLGTLGLSLPELLSRQAQASSDHVDRVETSSVFGRAKRVILLFMWGGPAHQDTWDLKPEGPVETRGEFLPIATNVPGMHISEHFPLIARQADKLALIRSVGQEDNNHSTGAHAGLTGRRHELKQESFDARQTDFPHFGSVLSALRPNTSGLPTFVALPEVIHTTNGAITPGQGGGLVGRSHNPFQITQHPDRPDFSIESLRLPESVGLGRMASRRSLLSGIDQVARLSDRSATAAAVSSYYESALNMVLAPQVRGAFDLSALPEAERFRYGYHAFGQGVLLAKRLVETGVQLVTVYWHRERRTLDTSWDTHARNFTEMRSRLMPSVDRPIAALLEDLSQSGLLDETLVVWNSEFGRTPKVNGNGGRDHWGPCNTVMMAGGGVEGGQVYGASDEQAAYPIANKVTQDDIAATMYHLLGLHPETRVYDRTQRPHPIALGEPIFDLLGGKCRVKPASDPEPIIGRPKHGTFTRMLLDRGGRFLSCDLGNTDGGEVHWNLTGWAKPGGEGSQRNRSTGKTPVKLQYTEKFYNHFDYGYLVLRLAEARSLDGLTLSVNGKPLPLSDELQSQGEKTLWQIPFPAGLIRSISSFELTIDAADWALTDIALVGDEPIRDLHLQRLNA